ncbi:hypothetical protein G5C60_09005 [Streptomyces sp. HC44]|uniref:Integral membrane protein n=1 Tax=Streptomyces scabichelini TaxID=2711217 RepID=A0A6G4V1D7_9ACTN|nr:DUF6223 family protein [Streptomyces scabichelini]NGO07791.1 hypothetical protein [Streptomyces scabichelini]
MSVRRVLAVAGTALTGVVGLAAPAAANAAVQPVAADAYTMTGGRLVGTVAALVALAGVVVGGLALARPAGRTGNGNGKRRVIVALVAGLTGMVIGALNLAVADGGPGTGNGVVGGAAALVLGLIAMVIGGLALARSRRTGRPAGRPEYERASG